MVIVRIRGVVDKASFESPKVEAVYVPLPQVCVALLSEKKDAVDCNACIRGCMRHKEEGTQREGVVGGMEQTWSVCGQGTLPATWYAIQIWEKL